MVKVARLYYKERKSKKEIGALLRPSTDIRGVTWLLNQAEQKGIVRIQIHETVQSSLEQMIRAKYPHLQAVRIAAGRRITTPEHYDDLYQRWATLAADYFEELWEQHPRNTPFRVGVTGGQHLAQFANAVPERMRDNVHIYVTALIARGRLDPSTSHLDPVVTASILWSRCGSLPGNCEYATVSPYVSDGPGAAARRAVREEIAKVEANATVREVIEGMDDLDVVFAGLGIVNPGKINPAIKNRLTMTALLQRIITAQQLEKEGAIGDFSYCLFDGDGRGHEKWRFFLTAGHYSNSPGIEFYKRMTKTPGKKIVAFGGPFKLPAIKAALKAEIFNVWITDEATAREIAEM